MKIGMFTMALTDRDLEAALDTVAVSGCRAVEIATGGYVGAAHCRPRDLLEDAGARRAFQRAVEDRGLEISAFSCHGNPLHPDAGLAREHDADFRATVELAAELGVEVVVTLSGCPGDQDGSRHPSWIVCTWPEEGLETLEWQWEQRAVPYWRDAAEFCAARGVRVGIEPHPGFLVYNVSTWRRLREAAGPAIAVNLDPSHFFWQGMDPLTCVRELAGDIAHVHAKDTAIDPRNVARDGVLDPSPFTAVERRSWLFRTVGYAHDLGFWRAFTSELRAVGYDGVLSIEHEDPLVTPLEGLAKAARLLEDAVLAEPVDDPWWAG